MKNKTEKSLSHRLSNRWQILNIYDNLTSLQSLTGPVQGRIYYTGKTLFWPCTGPVRDCSDVFEQPNLQKRQSAMNANSQRK